MKRSIIFFMFLYLSNTTFIKSAQASSNQLIPTFTWSNKQKNNNHEEISPDPNFITIANLTRVVTYILEEKSPENHWIFSSINYPNFKQLRVQKTHLANRTTELATYTIQIPADNRSHTATSIWGYHPYATNNPDIGLTPSTVTKISEIFAQNNNPTSRALLPIVHCLTNDTFTYAPKDLIPEDFLSSNLPLDDNKRQYYRENQSDKK